MSSGREASNERAVERVWGDGSTSVSEESQASPIEEGGREKLNAEGL